MPDKFLYTLEGLPGFSREPFLQAHQEPRPVTSVRLHPVKKQYLPAHHFRTDTEKIAWCETGIYLKERPSFTRDPLFHTGAYYVQEASSMFLEQALMQNIDPDQSPVILDLCAAPGGKSTHILSLLKNQGLLVSNEVIKSRTPVLCENISKWGYTNVIVTQNDPRDFCRLPAFFDVIVADAPCSGSGLFRKDQKAIHEWSENNVMHCSQRQQRILADVLPALKPGGLLVYSTCSYSREEDEDVTVWLTRQFDLESQRLNIDAFPGIVETENDHAFGYRFYPHKIRGEGFFVSVFRKKQSDSEPAKKSHPKNKIEPANKKELALINTWANIEALEIFRNGQHLHAIPKQFKQELECLKQHCYLKKAGVRLGEIIRDEFVPDHELALSMLTVDGLQRVSLNQEQALQYLKKQDLRIDTDLKGWAIVQFEHLNLGWVKLLANRVNNYYPREWRILME